MLTSGNIFTVPQTKAIRNMAGKLYMRVMEADSKCVYIQNLMDESIASLGAGDTTNAHDFTFNVRRSYECVKK